MLPHIADISKQGLQNKPETVECSVLTLEHTLTMTVLLNTESTAKGS